ncbi:class I SAM-dependent methyltransferase [Cohnella sp. AR92]|uniref:tRNA (mnm(5)s(2)U34)-methyltransferase n=1 Tax=Cohnella sp. AR92 TaxID=648716 RepID=UPI000F8E060A|nr:class I SAM-dependent methyltransferase [Cohnella sp. AR92]RUS45444.1 SAM-dependent methyltransferase [Cohnella sp. AR92]
MGFLSVLTMAQRWAAEQAPPGSVVIDATAGGGVDTLFLARTVGSAGHVYAFDVQKEALDATRQRLLDASAADKSTETEQTEGGVRDPRGKPYRRAGLAPVQLLHAGHERMGELVATEHKGKVRAVMFNLGYFPAASEEGRKLITLTETTLAALTAALDLLSPGGIITIVLYPGHEGGGEEAAAVADWSAALPASAAQSVVYRFQQKPNAPYLVAIQKR